MAKHNILYSDQEGMHFLNFQGHILHPLAPAMDGFIQELARWPTPRGYLLDLTETESIDSTMLGLLARIAKLARQQGTPPPTLVCPNEDIIDLLMGIGFDEVFSLVACDGAPLGEGRPISPAETDDDHLTRTMLEAHQELIALRAENRILFEDVLELLHRRGRDGIPG
jgi:anti-anti-sigma factor